MKKFDVKSVVATAIGAAILFILMKFIVIPTPIPNTVIQTSYGFLALFAAIFGPIPAALAGFIAHILVDSTTYGIWISWELTTGLIGLAMGFWLQNTKVDQGEFNRKDQIHFILGMILINVVGWAIIAPTLDILIYAEPASKVFTQGIFTAITNACSSIIIGWLLIKAYANTRIKSGSLKRK